MPYPVCSIPVSLRNRNTGATSVVNIPANQWGCPIDIVVPWELPYNFDDRAKITVGAQVGTVSFGRQVGYKYRMAHIRGIQLTGGQVATGTITTATASDPQPPVFTNGDSTFQIALMTTKLPRLVFGPAGARIGEWAATGGLGTMTRQSQLEAEPGRRVFEARGRIRNAAAFLPADVRNINANSLMASWWFYCYPESALVKFEVAFWYFDVNNRALNLYRVPEVSMAVDTTLNVFLKWKEQRIQGAGDPDPYLEGGRRFQDLLDVTGPLQRGQGALFTGFLLDQTRLNHTHQDFTCQSADANYQYWINGIAARSAWEGQTPVWGVIPPVPESVADPLVFDALTIQKYQQLMDVGTASSDPVFDVETVLWASVGEGGNPTGDQADYGHGKASMYWGLNADGNPDAVEFGYWGVLPLYGVVGKFYHPGPDEPARTDKYAPGMPDNRRNAQHPGHNKNDGSLFSLNYVNGEPDEDFFQLWPTSTIQDYRRPEIWMTEDNTGNARGPNGRMRGTDTSHSSNWGLLYANVTTGSWALLELMRAQTVMYQYSHHPWGYDDGHVQVFEQTRAARALQCVVNGYCAEHDGVRRINLLEHLRVTLLTPQNVNSGGYTIFSGLQRWRRPTDQFYAAPNRAVTLGSHTSGPNADPPFAYAVTSSWQLGLWPTCIWIALNVNEPRISDIVWAAFYSFIRYHWEEVADHPETQFLYEDGNVNEGNIQAAKAPGWIMTGYVSTPGMVIPDAGGADHDGGEGWGPDTNYPDWTTATKTAGGHTLTYRSWFARRGWFIGNVSTGSQPEVTFQERAGHPYTIGRTGTFTMYFRDTGGGRYGCIPSIDGARTVTAIDVTTMNITGITASTTPVITFSAPHGLTNHVNVGLRVSFAGTNSTPVIDGTRTVFVQSPTTVQISANQVNTTGGAGNTGTMSFGSKVRLEPNQVTVTTEGGQGKGNYDTAWAAPEEDEGHASNRWFNEGPDARRAAGATVDWEHYYGLSAVRAARLLPAVRPSETVRNNFVLQRIDDILNDWTPRYHARTYTHPSPLVNWQALMRDMDWPWPVNYSPSGDAIPVTARWMAVPAPSALSGDFKVTVINIDTGVIIKPHIPVNVDLGNGYIMKPHLGSGLEGGTRNKHDIQPDRGAGLEGGKTNARRDTKTVRELGKPERPMAPGSVSRSGRRWRP